MSASAVPRNTPTPGSFTVVQPPAANSPSTLTVSATSCCWVSRGIAAMKAANDGVSSHTPVRCPLLSFR
jgi:hypothetical protein